MGKDQKYNQIGKDIENALSEGLKSGNWDVLTNAITSSVDTVLDDVGAKVFDIVDSPSRAEKLSEHREAYSKGEYTRKRQEALNAEKAKRREAELKRQAEEAKRRNEAAVVQKRPKDEIFVPMNYVGRTSSTAYMVIGGIGALTTSIQLVKALPSLLFGQASITGVVVAGVFLVLFGGILNKGINEDKRLRLAKRYACLCGKKGYEEVDMLASSTGRKRKQVIRDIKKLLGLGFFPQGHIAEDESNLILTDEVYRQYVVTKKNQQMLDNKEVYDTIAYEVDANSDLSSEEQKELNQMITEGNEYIRKLHELNDKIPGEVITQKLYKLEDLLKEIFARVKEHPEQMSRMHELMEYYLPTMLKLVTAYEEYDKVSEAGEDIIEAKKDIEHTLDAINIAFKKLLNNLFKDSVLDVTTDAQVLKTVLAQKGLVETMGGKE